MATERRPVSAVLADTRRALGVFEQALDEFSTVVGEIEEEVARTRRDEAGRRKGWL